MASPTTPLAQAEPPPPPRRRLAGPLRALRLFITIFVAAGALAGVIIAVANVSRHQPPPVKSGPPPFEVPLLDVARGSAIPAVAPVAPKSGRTTGRPTDVEIRKWASDLSARTQVPTRSLLAYAKAELAVRTQKPGCRLNWSTLAGVGRVESHHGSIHGSAVGADGRTTPPIIGVPLDGSPGVKAVPDTDRGRLDGDKRWDHAVGAMQFLPKTWLRYAIRANGDGHAPDPQNIDDAALAAGRFLCAHGGNLSTADGWWRAVYAYNHSVDYCRNVFSGADAYAKAASKL